jgi:hypothetical protein
VTGPGTVDAHRFYPMELSLPLLEDDCVFTIPGTTDQGHYRPGDDGLLHLLVTYVLGADLVYRPTRPTKPV